METVSQDGMKELEKVEATYHFECKKDILSVKVLDYGYIFYRTTSQELLWNYRTNTTLELVNVLDIMILKEQRLGFVTINSGNRNRTFHVFENGKIIRSKELGRDYWMSMPLSNMVSEYQNKVYFQGNSHGNLHALDLESFEVTTVLETQLFIQNAIVCDYGIAVEFTNESTYENNIFIFQDKEIVCRIESEGNDCFIKGVCGSLLFVRIDNKVVTYDWTRLERVSEACFKQPITNVLFTTDHVAVVGSKTIFIVDRQNLHTHKQIPIDNCGVCMLDNRLYSISHDKTTFTPIE